MKVYSIPIDQIEVPPDRQRKEFNSDKLAELAASIDQNGLIHPIIVRKSEGTYYLVAGERRLRSLDYVWNLGGQVRCGAQQFPEGHAPCLDFGEMDPLDAFEVELEENVRREDLSWQDRSRATSQLLELRRLQAEKHDKPIPTIHDIAVELAPDGGSVPTAHNKVRRDIILAKHLDDPDVMAAKTADEGYKVLVRKETARRNTELSVALGPVFSAARHTLIQGDCLVELAKLAPDSFDVILTDPPYGINAQDFNDSGSRTPGGHFYNDSPTEWRRLMEPVAGHLYRVARPDSHLYMFCDIEMFEQLKVYLAVVGWNCFRTPIVWVNPQGMRAPWPEHGPQRKYQICLYAMKGKRPVNRLAPDVITCGSDTNLGHNAQKPVELYTELLRRSCRPGDSVLDPFCGSGPVFPAAHSLQCYATGIEIDPAAAGIAGGRIQELK